MGCGGSAEAKPEKGSKKGKGKKADKDTGAGSFNGIVPQNAAKDKPKKSGGKKKKAAAEDAPGDEGAPGVSRSQSVKSRSESANPLVLPPAESSRVENSESDARQKLAERERRLFSSMLSSFAMGLAEIQQAVAAPGDDEADDDDFEPARRCSMKEKEKGNVTMAAGRVSPRTRIKPTDPHCRLAVTFHDKEDDCWVILRGKIFDVTALLEVHDGGAFSVYQHAGTDCTQAFIDAHGEQPGGCPWDSLSAYFVADVTD